MGRRAQGEKKRRAVRSAEDSEAVTSGPLGRASDQEKRREKGYGPNDGPNGEGRLNPNPFHHNDQRRRTMDVPVAEQTPIVLKQWDWFLYTVTVPRVIAGRRRIAPKFGPRHPVMRSVHDGREQPTHHKDGK